MEKGEAYLEEGLEAVRVSEELDRYSQGRVILIYFGRGRWGLP